MQRDLRCMAEDRKLDNVELRTTHHEHTIDHVPHPISAHVIPEFSMRNANPPGTPDPEPLAGTSAPFGWWIPSPGGLSGGARENRDAPPNDNKGDPAGSRCSVRPTAAAAAMLTKAAGTSTTVAGGAHCHIGRRHVIAAPPHGPISLAVEFLNRSNFRAIIS